MSDSEQKYIWEDNKAFKKAVFNACVNIQAANAVILNQQIQILSLLTHQEPEKLREAASNHLALMYKKILDGIVSQENDDREIDSTDISELIK